MSQKVSTAAGIVGGGMAAGPAFYESTAWLSVVAILGITVLILTVANGILTFRRNLKWDGHERRGEKR